MAIFYKGEDIIIHFKSVSDISDYTKVVKVFTPFSSPITATINEIDDFNFTATISDTQSSGLKTGTLNIVLEFSLGGNTIISKSVECQLNDAYLNGGARESTSQNEISLRFNEVSLNVSFESANYGAILEVTQARDEAVQAKDDAQAILETIDNLDSIGILNASTGVATIESGTVTLTATPPTGWISGQSVTVQTVGNIGFGGVNFTSGTTLQIGDELRKRGTQWELIKFLPNNIFLEKDDFTTALQTEVDRNAVSILQFGTQLDGTLNDTIGNWKFNELGFATQSGTIKQVFLWANGAGNIPLSVVSVLGTTTTLIKTLGTYAVVNGFNTIDINQSIVSGQFVSFGKGTSTAGIRFKGSGYTGNRFVQSTGTSISYGSVGSYYALGFSVEYGNAKPLDIYTTKTYVDNGLLGLTVQKIQKIVRLNGTVSVDCDFTGNRAIQDCIESINDASKYKQYEILVYDGIYEATQTTHYNADGITSGMVTFLRGKSFISVRGINRDRVILRGTLPTNLTASVYQYYQTAYWHADMGTLSNITIEGSNMRYPLHIDGSRLGCKDFVSNIENVRIVHFGNTGNAAAWTSYHPIGLGLSDGQEIYHKYDYIISKKWPLYAHNNGNFSKGNVLKYDYCHFETLDPSFDKKAIRLESLGSSQQDIVELNNCSFTGCFIISHADSPFIPTGLNEQYCNHADFRLQGSGNTPFLYEPSFSGGQALRIISKSTGTLSSVRFDTESTAYPLIIKNNKYTKDYVDDFNVNHVGYSYKDGFSSYAGYAIGELDVGEGGVSISSNVYIKSLGKRLGDCSIVNKVLSVVIDGTTYNITFDKNYIGTGTSNSTPSTYTNAQIIAEIVAVIGSVANVDTYAVGNDYYPEFTDVMSRFRTSEVIQKGMAVTLDNGYIRKALLTDEKITGIALDTSNTGEFCRVMKKGYMRTAEWYRFYTLQETYESIVKGDKLGISATAGKISKTATNKLFTCFQDGIVTVNI